MIGLNGIEALAEQLVEGTFGRLFRLPLHPSELLRRLMRAMEDGQQLGADGHAILPNRYRVLLSLADFAALGDRAQVLSAELARCLQQVAEQEGSHFSGPLEIALQSASHLTSGQVEVTAASALQATSPADTQAVPPLGPSNDARAWKLCLNEQVFQLGEPTLRLGRALDNNIILGDARVSRHHARLRWQDGQYHVSDAGSRLGLAVNGQAVAPGEEVPLTHGDRLSLGGLILRVYREADQSTDETAPLPPAD
jgi:hypothetical protein